MFPLCLRVLVNLPPPLSVGFVVLPSSLSLVCALLAVLSCFALVLLVLAVQEVQLVPRAREEHLALHLLDPRTSSGGSGADSAHIFDGIGPSEGMMWLHRGHANRTSVRSWDVAPSRSQKAPCAGVDTRRPSFARGDEAHGGWKEAPGPLELGRCAVREVVGDGRCRRGIGALYVEGHVTE